MIRNVVEVLLLEDNPGHAAIVEESLKDALVVIRVTHVDDAAKAWKLLSTKTADGRVFRPDLVLLDLSLPGMSSLELLSRIKNDEFLGPIPVIVMASHVTDEVLTDGYGRHANCVVHKPSTIEGFADLVHEIEHLWLGIATLPPRGY